MTDVEQLTTALIASKERGDEEAVKELKYQLFYARQAERADLVSRGERSMGMIVIENNTEDGV